MNIIFARISSDHLPPLLLPNLAVLAASPLLGERLASAMVQVCVDVFLPILTPASVMVARVYMHACAHANADHVYKARNCMCVPGRRVGVDAGYGQDG